MVLPLFQARRVVRPMPGRYPVERVAELARQGRVVATKRVTQWLMNHDYDAKETILGVLSGLGSHGRFIGSCDLVNGQVADEYIVEMDDEDWYLKFWVDDDQVVVNVWSCCWDGVVH
jgi:hypothetical protein